MITRFLALQVLVIFQLAPDIPFYSQKESSWNCQLYCRFARHSGIREVLVAPDGGFVFFPFTMSDKSFSCAGVEIA